MLSFFAIHFKAIVGSCRGRASWRQGRLVNDNY
jgi:hypothetical protein